MLFNFHGLYTDDDKNRFRLAQEEDKSRICNYLKTDEGKVADIRFEVFDTRESKQATDPHHSISRASARFNENTLYRVWIPNDDPHFPHEITHLIAHTWAKPYVLTEELDTAYNTKIKKTFEMVSTSFMQEGLAIAVDDIVFQRKLLEEGESKYIDDWCREQLAKMPPTLEQVINLDGFGSIENKVVVPFAASVSKYLLQKFGVDRYKRMYIRLMETNSPSENIGIIEEVYQLSGKQILSQWRKSTASKI
jgi:hypothetical protein